MEATKEEWRIVIPKQHTKLVSVHEVMNGITVSSKKILIGELILSLLDQLDEHLLVEYLLRDGQMKTLFETIVDYSSEHAPEQMSDVLKKVLALADDDPSEAMLTALFRAMGESQNLAHLSEEQLVSVLQSVLTSASHMKDKSILMEMYLELLKRIRLFDDPEADLLSSVIGGLFTLASQFTDAQVDLIDAMFDTLAKKATPKALIAAARPYMKDQKLCSPLLPKNCVFYQERGNGEQIVGIELDKGQHDVVFGDVGQVVYEQVGYPKLLFWFSLHKGKAQASVAAVKDLIIKEDTQLYEFPYSNVHSNGEICWTTLANHKIKEVRQLEALPALFLGATKNTDLYRNAQEINLRDLLVSMQHQRFDDAMLKPMNKTVGQLIQKKS
ncbi:hypothetical protein [Cohnella sp. AR92]|uniref:hypothetical protein n=1 Tax=Cohnella sp. AR92 TaxID=648716 RepID=UPI000F8E3214|nr:hypothetical protein [Cohnella sp. AR92]RUS44915.1 hypothetical protein ELR57_21910 [Cohnella sp. AR92]